MSLKIEVRYEGLRQIEENLRFLREQFGVKTGGIIIRALRVGAKMIRDEARRRVPKVPSGLSPFAKAFKGRRGKQRLVSWESLLRSNIIEHAIPVSSRLAGGKPTVLVRVRNHGYHRVNGRIVFNRPGSSPGWWWWLEFGTARMPARPFLRPAFEAVKGQAAQATIAAMRREIDEFFARNLKKAA